MTDNEIIKALECCVQNTREACVECPIGFEGRDLCLNVAMEEAIGLINRQKAEIEELQHKIMSCNSEIERLKLENLILSQNRFNLFQRLEYAEKIESKARKEFAEKVKALFIPEDDVRTEIDNLVKEMTEQTTFEKVEHNSLCETETYKGGE